MCPCKVRSWHFAKGDKREKRQECCREGYRPLCASRTQDHRPFDGGGKTVGLGDGRSGNGLGGAFPSQNEIPYRGDDDVELPEFDLEVTKPADGYVPAWQQKNVKK